MPVDHKRINGPEDTVPYTLFARHTSRISRFESLVKPNGTRLDGRKIDEHRKVFLTTGVVSQAKGSAYIENGKTKVIVAVYDPREIPNKTDYSAKGEIYCEFKFAPFSCKKRRLHQQDSEERAWSAQMKQALGSVVCLHEFPNFQVDIYAYVLENDGSALSAAINAAGVALAQAGIAMYDLVTSVTASVRGDKLLLDPNWEEEDLCGVPLDGPDTDHGLVVYSMLNTHEQVSQFYQSGSFTLGRVTGCIEELRKAAKCLVPLVEQCLVKYVISSCEDKAED